MGMPVEEDVFVTPTRIEEVETKVVKKEEN